MNRTGPERESDTLGDTNKGPHYAKSLKILEASTGIEPVYTDLQSAASPLRQLAYCLGNKVFRGVRQQVS